MPLDFATIDAAIQKKKDDEEKQRKAGLGGQLEDASGKILPILEGAGIGYATGGLPGAITAALSGGTRAEGPATKTGALPKIPNSPMDILKSTVAGGLPAAMQGAMGAASGQEPVSAGVKAGTERAVAQGLDLLPSAMKGGEVSYTRPPRAVPSGPAPTGYERDPATGKLVKIATGGGGGANKNIAIGLKQADLADKWAGQLEKNPNVIKYRKDMEGLAIADNAISNPSPITDKALAFAAIQSFIPKATSRINPQGAEVIEGAESAPQSLVRAWQKAAQGQSLLPEQRKQIRDSIQSQLNRSKKLYDQEISRVKKVTSTTGIDPSLVIPEDQPAPSAQAGEGAFEW